MRKCRNAGDYMALTRRAFRLTPEERSQARPGIPVWWPLPAENTLDRATSSLPKLMHARMDEIGLDFAIVYPSLGLLVLTLPGMADDELRQASAQVFNNYNAEMFRGFADRLTPAAVIPMHTPGEAITELDHAVKTLGLKAAVFAADVLRPVPQPEKDPAAMAELYYYDCFGIDSPYDYDPVWRKCIELRVAPTFHSAPIGAALGRRSAAINTTVSAALRKEGKQKSCFRGRDAPAPIWCGWFPEAGLIRASRSMRAGSTEEAQLRRCHASIPLVLMRPPGRSSMNLGTSARSRTRQGRHTRYSPIVRRN